MMIIYPIVVHGKMISTLFTLNDGLIKLLRTLQNNIYNNSKNYSSD